MSVALLGCSRSGDAGVPGSGGAGGQAGKIAAVGGTSGGTGVAGVSGSAGAPVGQAGMSGTGGATGAGGSETAGTSGGGGGSGTAGTSGGAGGSVPLHSLDMNDVTILVPLPQATASPVLLLGSDLADDGSAMVPRALVDRLIADTGSGNPLPTLDTAYERLHVVAVRFDLCDRHLPGACPTAEDARMRLVFQPIDGPSSAQDTGFHAFYTIRNDEIAGAVAALRDLATTVPAQLGPLRVSPVLSSASPEPYAQRLRAFVRRYGGGARLLRLTMNAQNLNSAQIAWELRGVQRDGNAFVAMAIVGSTESSERVALSGTTSYDVMPLTDAPVGLRTALEQWLFDRADAEKQRQALAVLLAVDDPLSHTAETVACVACHVSTVVLNARAAGTAAALPGRYMSKFDLSTAGGKSAETPRTIRALGYLRQEPMISQRVVNETAQTLKELEQRYP
jgi:hypothetical protein